MEGNEKHKKIKLLNRKIFIKKDTNEINLTNKNIYLNKNKFIKGTKENKTVLRFIRSLNKPAYCGIN